MCTQTPSLILHPNTSCSITELVGKYAQRHKLLQRLSWQVLAWQIGEVSRQAELAAQTKAETGLAAQDNNWLLLECALALPFAVGWRTTVSVR